MISIPIELIMNAVLEFLLNTVYLSPLQPIEKGFCPFVSIVCTTAYYLQLFSCCKAAYLLLTTFRSQSARSSHLAQSHPHTDYGSGEAVDTQRCDFVVSYPASIWYVIC